MKVAFAGGIILIAPSMFCWAIRFGFALYNADPCECTSFWGGITCRPTFFCLLIFLIII